MALRVCVHLLLMTGCLSIRSLEDASAGGKFYEFTSNPPVYIPQPDLVHIEACITEIGGEPYDKVAVTACGENWRPAVLTKVPNHEEQKKAGNPYTGIRGNEIDWGITGQATVVTNIAEPVRIAYAADHPLTGQSVGDAPPKGKTTIEVIEQNRVRLTKYMKWGEDIMGSSPREAWAYNANYLSYPRHLVQGDTASAWAEGGLEIHVAGLDNTIATGKLFQQVRRYSGEKWWEIADMASLGSPTCEGGRTCSPSAEWVIADDVCGESLLQTSNRTSLDRQGSPGVLAAQTLDFEAGSMQSMDRTES